MKARITYLFISKTTIMVNKRETIYFIISVSDKQLSSFFISLILSLFSYIFFFPYHFCFNFVVSERNLHILFCRHIWAELSRLFWTFLSRTFLPGWGGGGCTCTQCTYPAYAPVFLVVKMLSILRRSLITIYHDSNL